MNRRWSFSLLLVLIFASYAEARVFSFTDATFGTYFKGNVGTSSISKMAFGDSSGTGTSFQSSSPYNFGGEIGLLFTSAKAGFRLGVGVVNPKNLSGAEGADSAGTTLMTLDSNVTAIVPSAHIEGYLVTRPTSKVILSLGVGYANVTFINSYHLTTAGQTAYPGVGDYTEEGSGIAIMGEGGIGWEVNLFDNVTTWIDAGYRYLRVGTLTHSRDATTFLGPVTKGSTVKTSSGADRALDLSGPWMGLGFRFYVNL